MNRNSGTIFCFAYVIGLLSTRFFGFLNPNPSWQHWIIVALGLGFFSIIAALFVPKFRYRSPRGKIWLAVWFIAILAVVYFNLRIPRPGSNDISFVLKQENSGSRFVTVEGKALSQGRLTQSQRVQFWFEPTLLYSKRGKNKNVTGRLYVTAPLSLGKNLYPAQKLVLNGILYLPKSASNPGAFDFKAYLNVRGTFAGFKALKIISKDDYKEPPWGWWKLRQRIVNAQVHWLGNSAGSLLSAMVLGRQAVDLPNDIRDDFIKVGLAHVLAASGFHVSLLLGTVLALTKNERSQTQLIVGLSTLIFYIGLTGIQPSIMRAGLMGVGTLIGLVMERKVKSLGSLFLAVTILLLVNPLWIWDLGFALSFLATLGLIITAPVLEKYLDWLPPTIANLIAIPIAASIWTLPLICYIFNTLAIYSIPANIITSPLILIISLGGTLSALVALILPVGGSAIALLLYYPIRLLMLIVDFFNNLPGNTLVLGKISLISLLLIYTIICCVWLNKWWQRRWTIASVLVLLLLILPIHYYRSTLFQVTVLADKKESVLIIQDRGKVILVSSGNTETAKYGILPFLRQQGINHIDYAVMFKSQLAKDSGWFEIRKNLAVNKFYGSLSVGETISAGAIEITLISAEPPIMQLDIPNQTRWLLVQDFSGTIPKHLQLDSPQVFLWTGKSLDAEWLDMLKPQVAIAVSTTVTQNTQELLKQKKIKLYWTGRDGAIQWTSKGGFDTTQESEDENNSLM